MSMKNIAQSMDPHEAAQSFYGQDDATFSEMLAKLTVNDPRLKEVFQKTRKRFLDAQKS